MTTTIPNRFNPQSLGNQAVLPNLRNGAPRDITSVAPKGSIPASHHWCTLGDLDPANAMLQMDIVIRCQYGLLENVPKDREVAIVLGAARCATTAMWRIEPDMLTREEIAPSIIRWDADHFVWTEADDSGNSTIARAHGMTQLSNLELRVCQAVIYMAAACVPLQGLSLVETDHHYLPTTAKFFSPVKKQVLATQSGDVKAWIEGMGTDFDDALWHKSCHPVLPAFKIAMSLDPATKEKMVSARLGSAAVRLPAMPSETKAGNAALALLSKTAVVLVEAGGAVDTSRLTTAIGRVGAARDAGQARQAVEALLALLREMGPNLAFCMGLLEREAESAAMGRNSLFGAFSLQKLKTEYASDYAIGRSLYGGIIARRAKAMEEGRLPVRDIR